MGEDKLLRHGFTVTNAFLAAQFYDRTIYVFVSNAAV